MPAILNPSVLPEKTGCFISNLRAFVETRATTPLVIGRPVRCHVPPPRAGRVDVAQRRIIEMAVKPPTAKWIGASFALSVPGGWGYFGVLRPFGLPRVERLLLFVGYFCCKNGYRAGYKCRILL